MDREDGVAGTYKASDNVPESEPTVSKRILSTGHDSVPEPETSVSKRSISNGRVSVSGSEPTVNKEGLSNGRVSVSRPESSGSVNAEDPKNVSTKQGSSQRIRRGIDLTQYEAAHKKRTSLAAIIIFIMIPLTVIGGGTLIGQHSYMLDSMVILIYTMLPFFMVFERRKPKAREIVLIAMMSALTAVVHMMFHFSVPIQAGTALVIIAGISLGPEAGFLIGALARFVCNFYLTQGSWTPWQMFCWGILGFLAGLAFNQANYEELKSRHFNFVAGPVIALIFAVIAAYVSFLIWPGDDQTFFGWRLYAFGAAGLLLGIVLQHKKLPIDGVTLALFTFFVTFIVYGGVMNVAAMITSAARSGGDPVHVDTLRGLYVAGFAYDLAHAGSAALFIFLFGEPLIGKLERIKIKYGIYR